MKQNISFVIVLIHALMCISCSSHQKKTDEVEDKDFLKLVSENFLDGLSLSKNKEEIEFSGVVISKEQTRALETFYNNHCNRVEGYINSINSIGYLGECSENDEKSYLSAYSQGSVARGIFQKARKVGYQLALSKWSFHSNDPESIFIGKDFTGHKNRKLIEELEILEDSFFNINYKAIGVGNPPIYSKVNYITPLEFTFANTSALLFGLGTGQLPRESFMQKGLKWFVIDTILLYNIIFQPFFYEPQIESYLANMKRNMIGVLILSHILQVAEVSFGPRKIVTVAPRAGFEGNSWNAGLQLILEQ